MKLHNLNGAWRMRALHEERWHDASVPGSVYADLLRDGSIEDPFYRDNELAAFELMKKNFEYCLAFKVDPQTLSHKRVLLRCLGLDTLAHVSLNGMGIGYADNMHITWEWDVKNALMPGDNELSIRFDSPILYALAQQEKNPGWGSSDAIPGFAHIRKAHCMFGWDWGPRLPDAGIWRDIELVCVDEARLDGVQIIQHHDGGQVSLEVIPEIGFAKPSSCEYQVAVTVLDGQVIRSTRCSGETETWVQISNPQLWWPSGYGEQPLYAVSVTLYAHGEKQDEWNRRVGLRTLAVSRQQDEWGEEFCHIVNGVKVFAMGADYIPEDNILARVNAEHTRSLLSDAKLANFNCIRVWGGGYYPNDFFFEACDELGLMVWMDFMFACAFYNLTPQFEKSIRLEAEQNVRRIRHHASLALLCGNNEMEMFQEASIQAQIKGTPARFVPVRPKHHTDYVKMFEYILPEICARLAPQTFYWPASPSSGGSFDDPNAENRGDVHYWEVWHNEKPFSDYQKFFFRYVSEFGFQSFPCLKTIESFTLPQDRNIFSRIMERHQRNKSANGKIVMYLSQTYQYPTAFEDLLYYSQLLQADAIRCGVEHWRRNRGRCMGAIIWQLNDCWPVASWSSIDYFGRWKALHYAAKRFFAPVMLSALEEGEHTQNPKINEFHPAPIRCSVRLNVANETRDEVLATVRWSLRTPDGKAVCEKEQAVCVAPLSSFWLDESVFSEATVTGHYVSYSLEKDGEMLSEGATLFCAPKHFEFADPRLAVRLEGDTIVVTSQAFAKHVCIDSEDADLLLSDNFFDMNPGERRVRILRGNARQPHVRCVGHSV